MLLVRSVSGGNSLPAGKDFGVLGTIVRTDWRVLRMSLKILGTCIREAPEIAMRKRRASSPS